MCFSRRLFAVTHSILSVIYVTIGAIQLVAGIFFLISLPVFKIGSNIWTGVWNIVIGIGGGMLSCVGDLSSKKKEALLYLTISILIINVVNIVILEIGEWHFFLTDNVREFISQAKLRKLVFFARITTSLSTAVAIVTAFIDCQFAYCSMQKKSETKNIHEQVSDIEYIIPRTKSSSVAKQAHSIYSQYAQSWVFDSENSGSVKAESPYMKLPDITETSRNHTFTNRSQPDAIIGHCEEQDHDQGSMFLVNPIVHVEQVSDGSSGNRSLHYMKSFSRTPSPNVMSESSSQDSNSNAPPIYECLERLTEPTIYRSRLNTALSLNTEQTSSLVSMSSDGDTVQPNGPVRTRSEILTTSNRLSVGEKFDSTEKVQYASLMVELQQAFKAKKQKLPQPMSPQQSICVEDYSDKTLSESKDSSCQESSMEDSLKTEPKSSEHDFSKELEAALQLIQDLESPNTIETPSETYRSIDGVKVVISGNSGPMVRIKWKDNEDSDTSKTLSARVSPTEMPEESTDVPQGKRTSVVFVAPAISGSESSSGYSSPSPGTSKLPTPICSKPSSVNNSSVNLSAEQSVSFAIHNTGSAAIISLFSQAPSRANTVSLDRKLPTYASTLGVIHEPNVYRNTIDSAVTITQNTEILAAEPPKLQDVTNGYSQSDGSVNSSNESGTLKQSFSPQSSLSSSASSRWNVKSLLKKKSSQPPVLSPELEDAVIKSESLAYLSDLELLARHARIKSVQREIEQRVQQKIMGSLPTESHC